MDKNTKYVLIALAIVGILYLLYRNRSESLTSEQEKPVVNKEEKNSTENKLGVYYTNWCGYSQRFNKELDEGLEEDINKLNVSVERIDCDKEKKLCQSLGVPGYPTLLLHKDDKVIQYNGDRSKSDLLNFISNNL